MFNPIKKIQQWNINRKQANLDKQYKLYGYSDDLLEKQVKLNQIKYQKNIKEDKYLQ